MILQKIASLFLTLGLFVLFHSCDGNNKSMFKADNGIGFDTVMLEKRYFLDDNPDNPSCNLTLKFIYPLTTARFDTETVKRIFVRSVIGNNYENLSVQEAVGKYAENYVLNYRNDAAIYKSNKPMRESSDDFDYLIPGEEESASLPEIFYSYYEDLSNAIVYNQYGILSFQVRQSNSKGGRMAYESIKNYVVDLANGTLLTEGDLFSAGYDMALRPLIQTSLLERNGVKSIEDLEDLGYFGIEEILPNKNFLVTDKGIYYLYNKGEYSAYQLPAPEVFIPFEAVRSLLREHSVVTKLSRL